VISSIEIEEHIVEHVLYCFCENFYSKKNLTFIKKRYGICTNEK